MPERKNVFVTGATGFLGSHLTLRLLQQGHYVRVLARGSKNTSPNDRVEHTLRDVAGSPELLRPHLSRLEVLEGDIAQDEFGLSARSKEMVRTSDEIWHC